jgi:hypothetical protein
LAKTFSSIKGVVNPIDSRFIGHPPLVATSLANGGDVDYESSKVFSPPPLATTSHY